MAISAINSHSAAASKPSAPKPPAPTSPSAQSAKSKQVINNGRAQHTGTIKWFDPKRGIGFASQAEGGDDLFVHRDNLCNDSEDKPPFLDEGVAICLSLIHI